MRPRIPLSAFEITSNFFSFTVNQLYGPKSFSQHISLGTIYEPSPPAFGLIQRQALDKMLESMLLLSGIHFSENFNITKTQYFQSSKNLWFCDEAFYFLSEQGFNYTLCFWVTELRLFSVL